MVTYGIQPSVSDFSSIDASNLEAQIHEFARPFDSFRSNENEMEPDTCDDFGAIEGGTQSQAVQYSSTMQEDDLIGYFTDVNTGQMHCLRMSQEGHRWIIGRLETNWIYIPDTLVSQTHCFVIWNGKVGKDCEIILRDNSKNGTIVNLRTLEKGESTLLKPGYKVILGGGKLGQKQYTFLYHTTEEANMADSVTLDGKYDIGTELGVGAFARVFRCIERATCKPFAVKMISKQKLMRSGDSSVAREIAILKHLNHEYIVSLIEHFEDDKYIYLILDLVDGPDLLNYVIGYASHGAYIPEADVQRMAAQICQAVAYIHEKNITHRDLKPENILLTNSSPPTCKVADFGLSKLVDDATFLKTTCGTPAYLAPEVMLRYDPKNDPYTNKVDSYSLGVIFFCMLTNCNPFLNSDFDQRWNDEQRKTWFRNRAVHWEILLDRGNLTKEAVDFVKRLLELEPNVRMEVSRALDHPWIRQLVPSQSRIFYGDSQSSTENSQNKETPTTDGAFACSQSMQQLQLSDDPIPGLSVDPPRQEVALEDHHQVPMEGVSEISEMSVTSKIPGAYPKPAKPENNHLPPLSEGPDRINSWEFVPPSTTMKRKSDYIISSSPLSSLSSEEDSTPPPPKRISPRRAKPRAASAPPKNPKKTRAPPSGGRAKRTAIQEEPATPPSRRTTRGQPAAKMTRRH